MYIKGFVIVILALGTLNPILAQDTTKRRSIDITSTFKPTLRESAKVNFTAAPPITDSTRPRLQYNLPAEQMLFAYQPGELKPLSFDPDTAGSWPYSNYIKVGFGNVHLPYVKTAFSFGDGTNSFFNLFANHHTSKGKLDNQKNSESYVGAALTYKTPANLEWNASLGFKNDENFLYGAPDSLNLTKEDLRRKFMTLDGKVGMRNIVASEFGITYAPSVAFSVFGDNNDRKGKETNALISVPVTKTIGSTAGFEVDVRADLTNYKKEDQDAISNNIFQIAPAFQYKKTNLYIHAGVTPSWDNGNFYALPNVMADITTSDKRLTLQLGWIGYFNKAGYQRFQAINPWIGQPDSLLNARVNEIYAGIKGSLGNHFSYSVKTGLQKHRDMALFINNPVDLKDFVAIYEPELTVLNAHAEAQYTIGEKFSLKGAFDWNNFTKQKREADPWGLLPLEFNATVRWQAFKDLWLKSEIWAFDGARYMGQDGRSYKGETGADLNAGAEFRVAKNINVWLQLNNILNNNYERWHRYEVFGFNILGGIVYSFNQTK